jgi:hypothetical protein
MRRALVRVYHGRALRRAVLSVLLLAAPLSARQPDTAGTPGVSAYLVVLAGGLNLREGPTLGARVVGVASCGERLCAVRYDGDWAEVRTPLDERGPSGQTSGFVSRGFVSETRATRQQLAAMGCQGPSGGPPDST